MSETASPAAALRDLCVTAAARAANTALRRQLTGIAAQLAAPLQVAVAGAVSGGKSTLVNAILGQSVAPADAGECTRVVTRYEYGPDHGRVEVELDSGDIHTTRLTADGRMPSHLGVDMAWVARIRVELTRPALQQLTVVDTPGVNTVTAVNEQAARRMLFGTEGADHAQALIYVLRYLQRFDADTLTDFRHLTATTGMTGVNTIALLSQVDRRGDTTDPWPAATRLAERARAELRLSAFDVVPVIGLLAETARARLLGPADLDALRDLAALDPLDLEDRLLDLAEFAASSPVHAALVARLHRYGLHLATGLLREDQAATSVDVHEHLLARSGYGPGTPAGSMVDALAHFTRRAEQLKALAAISELRPVVRDTAHRGDPALARLADAIDEGRPIAGGLAGLRVLAAAESAARGELVLDDDMLADLMRLVRHDDPAAQLGLSTTASAADLVATAREASVRWRQRAMTAGTLTGSQRARDVLAVLEELAGNPASRAALPVDADAVAVVAAAAWADDAYQDELRNITTAATVGEQVGAPPGAPPGVIADRAAQAAARFRVLGQRPLTADERGSVNIICTLYEAIWAIAQEG